MVALDYEQKSVNRRLVRVAIKMAVQLQTAVQVEEEARRMREREVAFRRLVAAETKKKGNRNEHKGKGKEGKSEKSESKKGSEMTEEKQGSSRHTREAASKGSDVENADPRRYEKQAEVIRSREPKIPVRERS